MPGEWSREEKQLREWERHCKCPPPFDPEECKCDCFDVYCSDCDEWDMCRCRAADDKYHFMKEEGLI